MNQALPLLFCLVTLTLGAAAAHAQPMTKFHAVEPCRALDTRTTGGAMSPAASLRDVQIHSVCGIPAEAQAVYANFTAVPTGNGSFRIFGKFLGEPDTETVSFDGAVVGNGSIVRIGSGGQIRIRHLGTSPSTHLIVDVIGYFK